MDKLKTIIPSFEVYDYKYTENGKEIIINDMDYYTVNDTNIESTLEKV
jgi:hypothetical protein